MKGSGPKYVFFCRFSPVRGVGGQKFYQSVPSVGGRLANRKALFPKDTGKARKAQKGLPVVKKQRFLPIFFLLIPPRLHFFANFVTALRPPFYGPPPP